MMANEILSFHLWHCMLQSTRLVASLGKKVRDGRILQQSSKDKHISQVLQKFCYSFSNGSLYQ
ncbi:hypothetical protein Peur_049144 [Populus x canadensis]